MGWPATWLNPVTGSCETCAPCVLSAVTGLPSDIWADEPMTLQGMHSSLSFLDVRAMYFPFGEAGIPLSDFGVLPHPESPRKCEGVWLLAVSFEEAIRQAANADFPYGPAHVIALEVRRHAGGVFRRLADNVWRKPTGLSRVLRRRNYTSVIRAGLEDVGPLAVCMGLRIEDHWGDQVDNRPLAIRNLQDRMGEFTSPT